MSVLVSCLSWSPVSPGLLSLLVSCLSWFMSHVSPGLMSLLVSCILSLLVSCLSWSHVSCLSWSHVSPVSPGLLWPPGDLSTSDSCGSDPGRRRQLQEQVLMPLPDPGADPALNWSNLVDAAKAFEGELTQIPLTRPRLGSEENLLHF